LSQAPPPSPASASAALTDRELSALREATSRMMSRLAKRGMAASDAQTACVDIAKSGNRAPISIGGIPTLTTNSKIWHCGLGRLVLQHFREHSACQRWSLLVAFVSRSCMLRAAPHSGTRQVPPEVLLMTHGVPVHRLGELATSGRTYTTMARTPPSPQLPLLGLQLG
jgi:hypothetical protein